MQRIGDERKRAEKGAAEKGLNQVVMKSGSVGSQGKLALLSVADRWGRKRVEKGISCA
jgi:hypothetical protein